MYSDLLIVTLKSCRELHLFVDESSLLSSFNSDQNEYCNHDDLTVKPDKHDEYFSRMGLPEGNNHFITRVDARNFAVLAG